MSVNDEALPLQPPHLASDSIYALTARVRATDASSIIVALGLRRTRPINKMDMSPRQAHAEPGDSVPLAASLEQMSLENETHSSPPDRSAFTTLAHGSLTGGFVNIARSTAHEHSPSRQAPGYPPSLAHVSPASPPAIVSAHSSIQLQGRTTISPRRDGMNSGRRPTTGDRSSLASPGRRIASTSTNVSSGHTTGFTRDASVASSDRQSSSSFDRPTTASSGRASVASPRPSTASPGRAATTSRSPSAPLSAKRQAKRIPSSNLASPRATSMRTPGRTTQQPAQLQTQSTTSSDSVQDKDLASDKRPVTDVADALRQDLAAHGNQSASDTVVILHDACYGHRYSRPRTSKSTLSMIVERPERIRASVLGVSTAYVRLGRRHGQTLRQSAMTGATDVPPFLIRKTARRTSLLDAPVVTVHGKAWLEELHSLCTSASAKLAFDGRELERDSTSEHEATKPPLHPGDLYLCAESLAAFEGAIGGMCDGVDAVFSDTIRRAFVIVRPPGHHCGADSPSGFCWLNNVHVGIEYAAQTYGLTHAAILDFDLHHGDGSQDIAWTRNARSATMSKSTPLHKKIAIGYYSIHDINSYPCESGDRAKVQSASLCIDDAHGQSVWNTHLQPWRTETEFWTIYEQKYRVLIDKARAFLKAHTARIKATPKSAPARSAIFVSAGFDASQWESAGMQRHAVSVPTSFYARFTADVVKLAAEDETAAQGRVISVLEGGYSDRALTSGVLSHLTGLCESRDAASVMGTVHGSTAGSTMISSTVQPELAYSDWWSADSLTALENHNSPSPTPEVRKARSGMQPTYASPTTSFSHKVVDAEQYSHSASGTMRFIPETTPEATFPLVDWVTAAHELSNLLIPTDRSTMSCKAEDLAAPRVKRDVLSFDKLSLNDSPGDSGRQLRERKAKPLAPNGVQSPDESTTPIGATPRKVSKVRKAKGPLAVPSVAAHSIPITALPLPNAVAEVVTPTVNTFSENVSTLGDAAVATLSSEVAASTRPANEQMQANSDATMDELSNGFKHIKLKIGSREEWEKRQLERVEAEKKAKAETRRRPRKLQVSPGKIKNSGIAADAVGSTNAANSINGINTTNADTSTNGVSAGQMAQSGDGSMDKPVESANTVTKTPSSSTTTQTTQEFKPQKLPGRTSESMSPPAQIIGQDSAETRRGDQVLPIWTANGAIPFATADTMPNRPGEQR